MPCRVRVLALWASALLAAVLLAVACSSGTPITAVSPVVFGESAGATSFLVVVRLDGEPSRGARPDGPGSRRSGPGPGRRDLSGRS